MCSGIHWATWFGSNSQVRSEPWHKVAGRHLLPERLLLASARVDAPRLPDMPARTMTTMPPGTVQIVTGTEENADAPWHDTVARFKRPHLIKSWWQVVNSLAPFLGFWYLMYLSCFWSYWLTLLLAVPTAGFLVRIFIIQHDCGHHSFFRSRRANDFLGFYHPFSPCFTPRVVLDHQIAAIDGMILDKVPVAIADGIAGSRQWSYNI